MPSLYLQCPCGASIPLKRWRSGKRICTDCGIAKGIVHSQQMQSKSGAGFNSWLEAMRAIVDQTPSPDKENDDGSAG